MPEKRIIGWALVVLLLLPAVASAQTNDIKEHKVVKGDTLWDISKQELKDPFLWPGIWKRNPGVRNPERIYPGQVIRIPVDRAGAEKKGGEVGKTTERQPQNDSASRDVSKAADKGEAAAVPGMELKEIAAPGQRRFEDIKGIVLYGGEVIEGRILSMNAEKVVIRTKNGTVLSYLFVEEIEDFIKD